MSTLYDHEYEAKATELLRTTFEARKAWRDKPSYQNFQLWHDAHPNLQKFLNPAFAFA